LNAIQLTQLLELRDAGHLRHWLGRLLSWDIVKSKGKTKGMTYFIDQDLLRKLDFKGKTSLKGIEPYRLQELILADLERHRVASIGEIHGRIGNEIPRRRLQGQLAAMVKQGEIGQEGEKRWRRYLWTKQP
jgi:ATP-dependent DNA helicase RecG